MEMRVWEDGESDGPSVMGGTEVELQGNIISRESGPTSIWSFITRELGKTMQEKKQMTAMISPAGAVSREVDWHTINWSQVHHTVSRLQARIVKAIQANRWGKVKALQRLLTHSFSGKAVAIKRVTENQGKRTPGVDGETWSTPTKKATAFKQLKRHGYRPLPLKRTYIPKSNGRMRGLSIPVMKDRAMQALYLLALDPIAETTADPNSYGFRKERSAADAIAQCYCVLRLKTSAQWILEGDIQSCFDKISHQWLLAHIPMDKTILRQWLKAGFMHQSAILEAVEGTPQGGICSPVLARFALNGLERRLREIYPKASPKASQAKVNVVVYADDFVITGCSPELLETQVKPVVEAFLRERGLELSPEKTRITHIRSGFDFLGQNLRRYRSCVLVKPAAKSVSSLLRRVRAIIKRNRQVQPVILIGLLNPILRGWATYHRHVTSKRLFAKVDHAVFHALWQWARRRHPTKPKQWVKARYFHSLETRQWVFADHLVGKDGEPRLFPLFKTSSVPIQRHIKIQGPANPYDPQWEPYFEARLGLHMVETLKDRKRLLALWLHQNGSCLLCGEKITKQTGWNLHHLVQPTLGGNDRLENLVILHPNCHRQLHHQGLNVVKPRPLTQGVIKA